MSDVRREGASRGAVGQSVLTAVGYARRDGALWCEGVSLADIAQHVGTPAYVYSAATIRHRFARLRKALAELPVRIHYSVKANSSRAILSLLKSLGAGVDIVSGGELHRALTAGFEGPDIVFSGVGKTAVDLERAVRAGVRTINVESEGELVALQEIAARLKLVVPVAFRVNPDIAVETPHRYTRTAERGMKFGVPHDIVITLAHSMTTMPNLKLVGLATHLGSQIDTAAPYMAAARLLVALKRELENARLAMISTLDLGGGRGLMSAEDDPSFLEAFADALRVAAADSDTEVLIEPGRFLVADAGVLLTRVLYRKHSGGTEIVITDAGMNDFIRPSLYESLHAIESVDDAGAPALLANVVGPVCESGDFFATGRLIPDVAPGQLLVIRAAGAYGYSMASNYNSRPRPAEVLVDGDRFALITERESDADLSRREISAPQWIEV